MLGNQEEDHTEMKDLKHYEYKEYYHPKKTNIKYANFECYLLQ